MTTEFQTSTGTPRTWKLAAVTKREPIVMGGIGSSYVHPNTATCERCAQSIRWVAEVRSSDGETLQVGVDCAATLQGGPSLRALRAAQRTWERAQHRAAHKAEWDAKKAEHEAVRAALAQENADKHGQLLGDLAEIAASDKCSKWEKDFASFLRSQMVRGNTGGDLSIRQQEIVGRCLRTARAPESTYVGTVGQRMSLEATFEREIYCGPGFRGGSVYRLIFRTDEGQILVWKTGLGNWTDVLPLRENPAGTRVKLTLTVDGHTTYAGVKQTGIARAKVEGMGSGYFYAVSDDPDSFAGDRSELLNPIWAQSQEAAEEKAAGLEVVGPFKTYHDATDSQRGSEQWNRTADAAVAAHQAARFLSSAATATQAASGDDIEF